MKLTYVNGCIFAVPLALTLRSVSAHVYQCVSIFAVLWVLGREFVASRRTRAPERSASISLTDLSESRLYVFVIELHFYVQ